MLKCSPAVAGRASLGRGQNARSLTALPAFSAMILSHAVLSETVITRPPPMLIGGLWPGEKAGQLGGRWGYACKAERVQRDCEYFEVCLGCLQCLAFLLGQRGLGGFCKEGQTPELSRAAPQLPVQCTAIGHPALLSDYEDYSRKAAAVAHPCRIRQHLRISSWP